MDMSYEREGSDASIACKRMKCMHAFYRNELHHAHQSKQRFKHAQTAGRSFLDWFCVCGVENVHSGPMTTTQPFQSH